jgi:predicted house-cleaning noncanonical NTP pyrophosphatase (MazG superfamily)
VSGYLIKLVRDKVEKDFIHDTHEVSFGPVEVGHEHAELLRKKLMEEVAEYLIDPCVGELADIAQVVIDLARVDLATPYSTVETVRAEKYNRRGGFRGGTGMYAIEVPESAR